MNIVKVNYVNGKLDEFIMDEDELFDFKKWLLSNEVGAYGCKGKDNIIYLLKNSILNITIEK
jgi:hypothetical protein